MNKKKMLGIFILLAMLISFASNGVAMEKPSFKVLVFTKTAAFVHDSIPDAVAEIRKLAAENNFVADVTDDAEAFTDSNLAKYNAVVFLLTTGDVLNDSQQAAFKRYISAGRGYVGIHSASDTEHDWPWYGRLVGAYFKNHPEIQKATIRVEDPTHPSTSFLPKFWERTDEWYNFKSNPRDKVHVLLNLDESTYQGGEMGTDHPIAWCSRFSGGRSWYTGIGHTKESYSEPLVMQHILGGIQWAAGIKDGACGEKKK
jgi:type 1 glutamine amidotransferase